MSTEPAQIVSGQNNRAQKHTTTGLPPAMVAAWERRIGATGPSSSRQPGEIRLSGPTGVRDYGQHIRVEVADPAAFDARMYVGGLPTMGAFCCLHTPFSVHRTHDLIREQPSDALVVGVHTLPVRLSIEQGSRNHAYRPGELAFMSNASPYVERTTTVADPAGLVIPLASLGKERDAAVSPRRPLASGTLLSRSAAAFVLRFAAELAVSGAAPDADTQAAAIELIRAALGELDYRRYHLPDNPLFVREAAIDLIDRNHRNPAFTPDSIARSLHISRRQLYRHFENADESLSDVIAAQRLQTACSLLTSRSDLSLAQVAAMSGFPSAATFRNRFRARYGVGPREYRSGSGAARVPTDDEARYAPSPDGASSKS